jgi:hypothetical protein
VRKNTEAYLGFGLMWREENSLFYAENILREKFGDYKAESDIFQPVFCSYYYKEMGQPLFKKFVVTDAVIDKSDIVSVKKLSMDIEDRLRIDGRRTVNIDPFYIDKQQLVVSTSKYRGNRIYMGDNIFVELELFYHHGSFHPFVWTYVDYKEHIPFFNKVRKVL